MRNLNLHILIFTLIALFHSNAKGQLSYGGKPLMNDTDFSADRVLYLLPAEDPAYINGLKSKAATSVKKALEYAVERPVDLNPDFNGEWKMKDGKYVWRAHIISPGAESLGVLFSKFELTDDAELFIYDPDGNNIKGAFTAKNNKDYGRFFVGHIPGQEVIIELQVKNHDRNYGKLRIGSVSHAFLPVFANKSIDFTGLGTSQDCEVDINCPTGDDWQILKRSVVYIKTTSLLCTGTLVNNTSYNGRPYILTAEHCINKDFSAGNSIFYFGYENSACDEEDGTRDQSISGSYLISTGGSTHPDSAGVDFSLLYLTERPPREFETYYAGWDARRKEHTEPVTIHHPNGDAKKISVDYNSTSETSSAPGDLDDYLFNSFYRIRQWDIGSTEGGSSGCPLFNKYRRLIGVLSGGLASCGDSVGFDPETNLVIYTLTNNKDDFYSRFSSAWDYYKDADRQLKKWLDPGSTGQVSIGGLNSILLSTNNVTYSSLSIFPNPVNDNFTIMIPDYTGQDISLKIIDMTGKVVLANPRLSTFPANIDASGFPRGIYIVKVLAKDIVYTGTLIVQ